MPLNLSKDNFISMALDVADYYAQALSKHQKVPEIIANRPVLDECYVRSRSSAAIFQANPEINYFREAGQYCYWLRKLKPFSFNGEDENPLKSHMNEFIAYFLATEVINISHDLALESVLQEDGQEKYGSNIDCITQNLEKALRIERRIVNSLRYHVHSAGGIPTLLEGMFGIPLDEDFAWGDREVAA